MQGQTLAVDTAVGVKVGTAYVVQADVETSNGVIHAIDSVLLPAAKAERKKASKSASKSKPKAS